LALIEAQKHDYPAAIGLWAGVFDHDPDQLGAGMNLAILQCGSGDRVQALKTLDRLLSFAPDNEKAREMKLTIEAGKMQCAAH
jgi:predicted TPR repeat methyltransferase